MGSELIVLSSDDEDDVPMASWLAKSQKRSKVLDVDNDLIVVEKVPCLEGRTMEESSLGKPPSDDDCCILNYDPENSVHVPDFQANAADDLVVVGERGPVACRDFPHARHLCVKFPFTTSSHEKYCEQCHCYVCDVVAPCLLWGQGKQSSDHCHAFDKDEKWKMLRTHARRSFSSKLGAPSHVPISRGQVIQPQLRTYTHPPLRVKLTTGVKRSTNHANLNANLSSPNRGTSNMNALPGNWQPYQPSKMGTVLTNSSYRNSIALRGTNMPCVRDPYPGSNVVPLANNRMRIFGEHNGAALNNIPATATSDALQQMIHQPPLNSVPPHDSIRSTQTGVSRHGAMPNNTHASVLQAGTRTTNFTNPPGFQYQGQGVEVPSVAPCNYVEGLGGTTHRIPARPHGFPLSNLGKDLVTLQGYLMEGISGQSQGHSTSHGMSMAETGCVQSSLCHSGDPSSNRSSWNREVEALYNPFEPSEMPENNAGFGAIAPQTAGTHATMQISKSVESVPEPIAGSKEIPELPLCSENAASSLDQILAGFDDDFWTLLEPAYPGF